MLCLERRAKSFCKFQAVEMNFSYVSRYAGRPDKIKKERKKLNGHIQVDEQRAGEKRQIHLKSVKNNI
jgi:hypothetical protein